MVSVCSLMARKWDITDIINRLSLQTYKDFEWVIVDFYYDDNKEIFQDFAKSLGIRIVHIPNFRDDSQLYMRDIARNRNEALVYASGDIIIFLDDYVIVGPTFIEEHVKLVNTDVVSCGKMYQIKSSMSIIDMHICDKSVEDTIAYCRFSYENDSREELLLEEYEISSPLTASVTALGAEWTYTGNLAFSMDVAEKLNGFDPRLNSRGEDCDFGLRANALGIPIMFNSLAVSANLPTGNIPCKSVTKDGHTHPTKFLNVNDTKIVSDPDILIDKNCELITKYGIEAAICKTCGAEYLLIPHKLIYRKLREGDLVTDKNLFNLIERRKNK